MEFWNSPWDFLHSCQLCACTSADKLCYPSIKLLRNPLALLLNDEPKVFLKPWSEVRATRDDF